MRHNFEQFQSFNIFLVNASDDGLIAFAQSICAHYSRVWNLKMSGPKYGPEKKQGAKNRIIVIQKEKKLPGLFSFE